MNAMIRGTDVIFKGFNPEDFTGCTIVYVCEPSKTERLTSQQKQSLLKATPFKEFTRSKNRETQT